MFKRETLYQDHAYIEQPHYYNPEILTPEQRWMELCKYQQSIIKKYQEYIEKQIHQKILEEDCARQSPMTATHYVAKRIRIPETELMLLCEPSTIKAWEWLKMETPLINPDYFISMAYTEKKDAKTN